MTDSAFENRTFPSKKPSLIVRAFTGSSSSAAKGLLFASGPKVNWFF